MLQYYTLDEAAKILRHTPEKVKELTRQRRIQALQDGKTWRFKRGDIEELARELGLGSDPELQLGEVLPPSSSTKKKSRYEPDDEISLVDESRSESDSRSRRGPRSPRPADSDVRLIQDDDLDFPIVEEVRRGDPASSSARRGRKPTRMPSSPDDSKIPTLPDDNDNVPLGASKLKTPSDSDIRLEGLPLPTGGRTSSLEHVTEEIDLDVDELKVAESSDTGKKRRPKVQPSPQLPTSSPFELSQTELGLESRDPRDSSRGAKSSSSGPRSGSGTKQNSGNKSGSIDSSSDFELIPMQEDRSPIDLGSEEFSLLPDEDSVDVDLGVSPRGVSAGNSGINLRDPADSGISLESEGSDELGFDDLTLDVGATPSPNEAVDSSSEFELTLDEDLSGADALESLDESSSEFELTLDDGGVGDSGSDSEFELTLDAEDLGLDDGKDIFETGLEDADALESLDMESGSEAVPLDEFDLPESDEFEIDPDAMGEFDDESGSQAVVIDEDVSESDETIAKPRKSKSKTKVKSKAQEDDLFEDEEQEKQVVTVEAKPAEWGALPTLMLFPAVIVLFLVGLMAFELMQNMWGYSRPGVVAKPLIHTLAKAIDETIPD